MFDARMAQMEADTNQGAELKFQTLRQLFDYYERVITPTKAPGTQDPEKRVLKALRGIYGEIPPDALTPRHINQVKHSVAQKRGVRTANAQLAILSHVMTMGLEWGAIDKHPMVNKQVTRVKVAASQKTPPYTPTDAELVKALKLCTTNIIPAYLAIKNRTGLRQTSILKIKLRDITMLPAPEVKDDILAIGHIDVHLKGGKRGTVWFDAEMYHWIEIARRTNRSSVHGPYLFQTRKGKPYINAANERCEAFYSLWDRWQQKVVKTGMRRFAERYIRNKVANDSKSLQDAQERLAHVSSKTTTIYRTNKNIVASEEMIIFFL